MSGKKNKRRISILITAQTAWHLYKLAAISGYGKNIGHVVDKLVREKMLMLQEGGSKWQ